LSHLPLSCRLGFAGTYGFANANINTKCGQVI
jgi:hypothetical protein